MWVEVISDEFSLLCGTNAVSAPQTRSLSIHGAAAAARSPFLWKPKKKKTFQALLSLFPFSGVDFDNSNFRSVTSCASRAGERSPVSEASRPLRLFDQRLGCEFRRSESGSEAPRGPPFTPATGGG